MDSGDIISIVQQAVFVAIEISAPVLIVTLVLGFIISLFMSVTQISETTLVFIPKLVAFAITFVICFPWMIKVLIKFTNELLITHWNNLVTFSAIS